ncbi:MAG: hypothetical protein KDK89_07075 [Alphaproteobacteria bacterium]|nr:hypothetical protein [Alphaproteobacteria bacterium]
MRKQLAISLVFAQLVAVPAQALDTVSFPLAARTAQEAVGRLDDRIERIINYVACGREANYYIERRNLAQDDDYQAGEALLEIMIGKIAWLNRRSPETGETCRYTVEVPAGAHDPDNLVAKYLDIVIDQTVPTRCASMQFFDVGGKRLFSYEVTASCMRDQVNEGVRAMRKTTVAGTTGVPCFGSSSFPFLVSTTDGEYDVILRDLTRLFYMGTSGHPVLETATINHMWEELLSLRGAPSDESLSPTDTCGNEQAGEDLGMPEDYADRESWYREVFQAIWDFFQWWWEFAAKAAATYLLGVSGVGLIPFLFALDPLSDPTGSLSLQIGESENHRLMIESARYLTNQKMLLALKNHPNLDDVNEQQMKVREWILKRLQQIANSDFGEYNARPYTRYSLNAITNLYEYADDPKIRTASQIVLDLSAAKFAAGSSVGRRMVPFRRLADADVDGWLYPMCCGGDNEIVRSVVFTGQTALLNDAISSEHVPGMIYVASGSYRWPMQVLEAAVAGTEGHGLLQQTIRHDGIEHYFSTPVFTMSLGGIPTGADKSFLGVNPNWQDHGAAVPTIILPTVAGADARETFRIRGTGTQEDREPNLCGYEGFICGTNPDLPHSPDPSRPDPYAACTTPANGEGISFITSATCFPAGPHFYAAAMVRQCDGEFCDEDDETWGLIEVVAAPGAIPGDDPSFDQFRAARTAALLAAVPNDGGEGTYVDAAGRSIAFVIDEDGSKVKSVDGREIDFKQTIGSMIRKELTTAGMRTIIGSPTGGREIRILFNDWNNPIREEQ